LCREAAVAALGSIGDDRVLPTILAALSDKATVRRRAVIALAPFDGPEVDTALRRSLDDRDRQVRQAAEDLLGREP
jgi:HEAT repeat protein